MLKYGIAIENIQYKMQLNGHDKKYIDMDPESKIPKELLDNKEENSCMIDSIKNSSNKLKKTEIQEKKIEKKQDSNVPTLEDILGSISSLKKTNYQNKYMEGIFYNKDQYLHNEKIKGLRKEINDLNGNTKQETDIKGKPKIAIQEKPKMAIPINPMQGLLSQIKNLKKID